MSSSIRRTPFDPLLIARHALAEADAFLWSIGLPAETDQDAYVAGKKRDWPLPSEAVLCHVLDEVFYASLAHDEGRVCRLRLLYDGDVERSRSDARPTPEGSGHWFQERLPLDLGALRRLSAVHDSARGALFWRDDGERAVLVGVAIAARLTETTRAELTIATPAPGHLIIGYMDHAVVAYRRGEMFLRTHCALPDLQRLSAFLGRDFLRTAVMMPRAGMAIADEGHGGSIWVAGTGGPTNGTRFDYPVAVREGVEEGALETTRATTHSLGKLASTDGAVVLDISGRLVGFGAFFDGPCPLEVEVVGAEGRVTRVPAATLGGARHRSAASFCMANAPAAALVVSEDGKITIMKCEEFSSTPRVAEVGPFGRESGA